MRSAVELLCCFPHPLPRTPLFFLPCVRSRSRPACCGLLPHLLPYTQMASHVEKRKSAATLDGSVFTTTLAAEKLPRFLSRESGVRLRPDRRGIDLSAALSDIPAPVIAAAAVDSHPLLSEDPAGGAAAPPASLSPAAAAGGGAAAAGASLRGSSGPQYACIPLPRLSYRAPQQQPTEVLLDEDPSAAFSVALSALLEFEFEEDSHLAGVHGAPPPSCFAARDLLRSMDPAQWWRLGRTFTRERQVETWLEIQEAVSAPVPPRSDFEERTAHFLRRGPVPTLHSSPRCHLAHSFSVKL